MNAFIAPVALALAGSLACWLDVRTRTLPNWLSLATGLAGLVYAALSGGGAALGWHALHGFVALVVGMGLFAIRAIGGGDAKYYAGVACWFAIADGARLLVCVATSGLIVLLGWSLIRWRKGRKVLTRAKDDRDRLPYGVAVALGSVITAWPGLFGA